MRSLVAAALFSWAIGCQQAVTPIVYPDVGCAVAAQITADRMIRDPDSGMPVVVMCDAGEQ